MSVPTVQDTPEAGVKHMPSETTLATATMRALAAHDQLEEIRGADNLAEIFLTEEQKAPLRDANIRAWVMKNKITPGPYEFMIARTAFFDEVFRKALIENIQQLVILGAGYDTRPFRFAHLLDDVNVFELDALPTQWRKKEMLERAGVRVPANVRFIPIDFVTDDLEETLLGAAYARRRITPFLWEGVTYYLSKEAIDRTLAAVRSLSVQESLIAFDFASLSSEALSENGIKRLREQMKSNHPGEPARFGIPNGKLELFLSTRGFHVKELIEPEQMQTRYLTLRDGFTVSHVPTLFNLVVAQAG